MASKHDWSEYDSPGHELVVTTVRVAEQISKAADRFLKPFGLTLTQFNILTVLSSHPEGMAQTQIGDELVVSRANVTIVLRRMIKAGLCEIREESTDARVKKVVLTVTAEKLLSQIRKPYLAEIQRISKNVAGDKAQQFLKTLHDIEEKL